MFLSNSILIIFGISLAILILIIMTNYNESDDDDEYELSDSVFFSVNLDGLQYVPPDYI